MLFTSTYAAIGDMPEIQNSWLREEPAFYGPATQVPGKIGRAFIAALPIEMRGPGTEIEVRVRYLKRGWCMGGGAYHFDVAESRADGNADPSRWLLEGEHTIIASLGNVAFTRVLTGTIELPEVPLDQPQDRLWDQLIRLRIRQGTLSEQTIPDGQLIRLGNAMHAATPAERTGIRVFLRARPFIPGFEGVDLHRPQQNIYLPDVGSRGLHEALLAAPYFPQRSTRV